MTKNNQRNFYMKIPFAAPSQLQGLTQVEESLHVHYNMSLSQTWWTKRLIKPLH